MTIIYVYRPFTNSDDDNEIAEVYDDPYGITNRRNSTYLMIIDDLNINIEWTINKN